MKRARESSIRAQPVAGGGRRAEGAAGKLRSGRRPAWDAHRPGMYHALFLYVYAICSLTPSMPPMMSWLPRLEYLAHTLSEAEGASSIRCPWQEVPSLRPSARLRSQRGTCRSGP